jgi:hypothetical protein
VPLLALGITLNESTPPADEAATWTAVEVPAAPKAAQAAALTCRVADACHEPTAPPVFRSVH